MSHAYRFVGWDRHKKIYDRTLLGGVLLYLAVFVGLGASLRPNATIETLLIRALGTAALLLLHVILAIGPLSRLDSRFLPLLYNRRHLGVTMFTLALGHGAFSIVQFHALGNRNPLVSVLTSNGRWGDLAQFPFHPLGFAALVILFLMAATSHDFWLANLTPPVWKSLHMLVYFAYGLIVAHVALGVLQAERNPILAALLGLGFVWVVGLHLVAGWRERAGDRAPDPPGSPGDGFVEVCRIDEIEENRARVACLSGERVAVFRYDGKVSAVSNVCQHQNGPLGEGRILDGCITCPWHGFQYEPHNGASPAPFTEKVPTFRVRLEGDRVLVDPRPNPPGTPVEAARIPDRIADEIAGDSAPGATPEPGARPDSASDFYVGYLERAPRPLARFLRRVVPALALGGVGLAAALATLQGPFDPGDFEFGIVGDFEGRIEEHPYPILVVDSPAVPDTPDRSGRAPSRPSGSFLLVAFGKHGADDQTRGLDGRRVTLRGSQITREGEQMIEIESGSVAPAGPDATDAAARSTRADLDLGTMTLRGEIVDSKCFLGVMKPGRGKPHRACATRCISGGVPPILRVETATGEFRDFLLTDEAGGEINDRILDFVAEPIEITGRVSRRGDHLVLAADPSGYRRL